MITIVQVRNGFIKRSDVTFFGFSGNTPPYRDHRALSATKSDRLRFIGARDGIFRSQDRRTMNFDRFELRPLLQAFFKAQDGLSELTFWSYSTRTH